MSPPSGTWEESQDCSFKRRESRLKCELASSSMRRDMRTAFAASATLASVKKSAPSASLRSVVDNASSLSSTCNLETLTACATSKYFDDTPSGRSSEVNMRSMDDRLDMVKNLFVTPSSISSEETAAAAAAAVVVVVTADADAVSAATPPVFDSAMSADTTPSLPVYSKKDKKYTSLWGEGNTTYPFKT